MKKMKKWPFILLGVIVVVSALTIYLNRVVFPVKLKQIVVTQAETFLKRKVEIESLRFNWVKGFVVHNIKVYQKDSDQAFLQAERLSFGIIYVPGFKTQTINIPFINIERPSAHVVRTGPDAWNFSDLLAMAAGPAAPGSAAEPDKPSPFNVSVAGITVHDGQVRIDDVAEGRAWSELVDKIQVKIGLSFKGISFDMSGVLPQRQGSLSAQGSYQPSSQAVDAQVKIHNISPSEYLSFAPPVPGFTLEKGLIENADLNVDYSTTGITAQGSLALKNVKGSYNGQSFEGTALVRSAHVALNNGGVSARGTFAADNAHASFPGGAASGSVTAEINQFDYTQDALNVDGTITAKNANLTMGQDQSIKGNVELRKIQARQDKDGIHMTGTVLINDGDVRWGTQTAVGDITLKPLNLTIDNNHVITASGDLAADGLAVAVAPDQKFIGAAALQNFNAVISGPDDIAVTGKLAIDQMNIYPAADIKVTGSVALPSLAVKLAKNVLAVQTKGELNNMQVSMGEDKSIVAESDFSVDINYPLENPDQLSYNGTLSIRNAETKGFPFGPLRAINLDSTFKTDQLTIKLLSLVAMNTPVRASGTVLNFKAPVLNVEADCDRLDLSKLKDIVPDIFAQYGLDVSGEASFRGQYQGLASDPAAGKINAQVALKNTAVSSSTFNQKAEAISGTVNATLNTISWDNFTATYLGNPYTLNGTLSDFKNPRVTTSLNGKDVQLNASAAKNGEVITISELKGKYLDFSFDTTGSVALPIQDGAQPILDLKNKLSFKIEDIIPLLPADQRKSIEEMKPSGAVAVNADIKGPAMDWTKWNAALNIQSLAVQVMGYTINDIAITAAQADQKISNLTADAVIYDGKFHAVGNSSLAQPGYPFDLALNIDGVDLRKLKNDNPELKSQEINGKFYLTTVGKGKLLDMNVLEAKGSVAIREGFLAEFKIFKGLMGILNEALKIGQVMITDVDGNFEIANQKITTDDLRLRSQNLVLITQGSIGFDQICNLKLTVDTTSGIIPQIALPVLQTLEILITDKIQAPKFTYKISKMQVINSLINTVLPIINR